MRGAPTRVGGAVAPTLDASYRLCRELNKRYGTTYYWSSLVLPRLTRHHVWALYAFCRYADDIVDDLGDAPLEQREKALTAYGDRFFADLEAGRSDDPVLRAVVHTVRAYGHACPRPAPSSPAASRSVTSPTATRAGSSGSWSRRAGPSWLTGWRPPPAPCSRCGTRRPSCP
jgi:hypothetical protein